jgi:hypothetical protein
MIGLVVATALVPLMRNVVPAAPSATSGGH